MAHPLGAFYDTPHGVANALLLPYVMEYNAESPAAPKYIHIAKAMNPLYIHTICLGRTSKFRKEALRFFHFIGNFLDIFKKVIDK